MDAALWENRPLVEPQLSMDLAAETVLHDKPGLELALHDDEELVGTGMKMRYIEPARPEEGDDARDVESLENGEVVIGGEEDRSTISTCRRLLVIEIKDCELPKGVTSEEVSTAGQQLSQLIDVAGLGHNFCCKLDRVGDEWDWWW